MKSKMFPAISKRPSTNLVYAIILFEAFMGSGRWLVQPFLDGDTEWICPAEADTSAKRLKKNSKGCSFSHLLERLPMPIWRCTTAFSHGKPLRCFDGQDLRLGTFQEQRWPQIGPVDYRDRAWIPAPGAEPVRCCEIIRTHLIAIGSLLAGLQWKALNNERLVTRSTDQCPHDCDRS